MDKGLRKEMEAQKKRSVLLVLSGPTAAGKDTLMKALLKKSRSIRRLVTTNSRPKRKGEKEGVDYHFVTRDEFERLISEDAFIEWVEYLGHYKGTQKKHLYEALDSGKDVLWRIDVKGVRNIKSKILKMKKDSKSPVEAVAFLFLTAPNLETLARRMRERGTENKQVWHASINLAKWEMTQYDNSDYLIINPNGKMDKVVDQARSIIEAERRKIWKE